MTISEAVQLLSKLRVTHGDVDVYFDCPFCGKSFAPNTVKAAAVHITSREPPTPQEKQ